MRAIPTLVTLSILLSGGCGSGDPTSPVGETAAPRPLEFVYLNRLPQPDDLHAVSEADGRALAVGAVGALVLRRDATSDWERIDSPTRGSWSDVLLLNPRTALAVTIEDGIWLSEDGGEGWELVHAVVGMRALAHGNGRTVAVGATVAFSSDLRTWTAATTPPAGIFPATDVTFAGDKIWALKSDTLFRSDDGGTTWLPFTTGSRFQCMAFADENFGVVGTGQGDILLTTNGSTFARVQELRESIVDVDFDSPSDGVLITREVRVATSVTRGQDWTSTRFDGIEEIPNDIEALGLGEYLIVGNDGLIAEVDENGTRIQEISSGFSFDLIAVDFANPAQGLALGDAPSAGAGPDALLLRTADGGSVWDASPAPVVDPVDLQVFGEDFALVLGRGGELMRSDDLGASWSTIGVPTGSPRSGILVLDARTWLICGVGSVLRTADAGDSWIEIPLSTSPAPLDGLVRFPGTSTVLAFRAGELHRSEDGGQTWTEVEGQLLSAFDVACSNTGVAIAVSDNIYRSTDQGRTWVEVLDAPAVMLAAAFLDALHGVAVGERGAILETLDGGRTWTEVHVAGMELRDVAVRGPAQVVMVGEDGAVIVGSSVAE